MLFVFIDLLSHCPIFLYIEHIVQQKDILLFRLSSIVFLVFFHLLINLRAQGLVLFSTYLVIVSWGTIDQTTLAHPREVEFVLKIL